MKHIQIHFNTIYSRILFFNLVLVICVTLIPIFLMTNYFIGRYNSQINQYNMQLARQTQNYIDDTVINKIVDIPNAYFSELDSNYDLTYPYYNDISVDTAMIRQVSARLYNIYDTYTFLNGINVYYIKSNIIFGVPGVTFLNDESSTKMLQSHEEIVNAMKTIDKPTQWLTSISLLGKNEKSPAVFLKIMPYSAFSEKRAILAIGFNEDSFYQFVKKIEINKDETLFIIDNDGKIILSTDHKQNGTKLKDENIISQLTGKNETGIFNANFDGKKSIISYSKSHYNDWRYVSVTSVDSYYRKSTQIKIFIFVSLLLLLPFNILLSTFITKAAHKPLSHVLNYIRNTAYGEIRGNNEYNLLENTFNGLNNKVIELSERLQESKPIIRQNAMLKLLQGNLDSYSCAEQDLVDISFSGKKILCVIFRLYYNNDTAFKERMLVIINLIALIDKIPNLDIKPLIDGNNRLTAIISCDNEVGLKYILSSISQAVESSLKLQYTICVGGTYDFNLENIHFAYEEAEVTYEYAYVSYDKKFLYYDLLSELENPIHAAKIVNRLEDYLKVGDKENAVKIIESMISEIRSERYKIESIKSLLMDCVTSARIILTDFGFSESDLFGGDIRVAFSKLESLREFENWFIEVCNRIIEGVNARRFTIEKEVETKIQLYIQENIYNELSLEIVADNFHLSSGYLSRISKSVFGMSFTDYVVNLKMQEAEKLLRLNRQTVKEIANLLGYTSVQYFIRIFKSKYGYTPKNYQKFITDGKNK